MSFEMWPRRFKFIDLNSYFRYLWFYKLLIIDHHYIILLIISRSRRFANWYEYRVLAELYFILYAS